MPQHVSRMATVTDSAQRWESATANCTHAARWESKALPPTSTSYGATATLSPSTAAAPATSSTDPSRKEGGLGPQLLAGSALHRFCDRLDLRRGVIPVEMVVRAEATRIRLTGAKRARIPRPQSSQQSHRFVRLRNASSVEGLRCRFQKQIQSVEQRRSFGNCFNRSTRCYRKGNYLAQDGLPGLS